jgi:DNA-binding transcriptional LysR family regulator
MINFTQLRAFYEAARTQSVSKAAANLYITQPAVTAQIRALESALEIQLFKKKGRSVALTEAGSLLLQHASKLFELEKEMERTVTELHALRRGLLKIGTTKTYARFLMPALITQFHARYPKIKIILDEGSSQEMFRSLLDLRNELAICVKVEDLKRVKSIPFRRERVALIASPHHALARQEGIPFEALEGVPIVMKEKGSGTHAVVSQSFAQFGITPNVLVETSNLEFIKDMVIKGEGVSFLVEFAVEKELADGRIRVIPLKNWELYIHAYIAMLENEELSPAGRAFLEILQHDDPVFAKMRVSERLA